MKNLKEHSPAAHNRRANIKTIFALTLINVIIATGASAQNNLWTAASGTNWEDVGNWSTGVIPPTGAGEVVLGSTAAGGVISALAVIRAGVSGSINTRLQVAQHASTAGSLTIRDNGVLYTNAAVFIANSGSALVKMEGNSTWAHIAASGANLSLSNSSGTGTLIMTGSSSMIINNTYLIIGGGGAGKATVTVDQNASITQNANNTTLYIPYRASGEYLLEIKDKGKVSIERGTVRFSDNGNQTGTGSIILTGTEDGARGTLKARQIAFSGATGVTHSLIFDGGMLEASANTDDYISDDTGATALSKFEIITKGDGAFINTGIYNVGIKNSADLTFTGTSGLTKLGTGALALSNTLAYTGATTVKEGTLVLGLTAGDQLARSTAVNIAAGATISSTNLAQTFNNLSGAGVAAIGTGAATLANTADTVFSGNLTAASITKSGTGKLTLSGANTISGNSTLNGGILALGNSAALGAGAGKTLTINSGTLANASASLSLAHNVTAQAGTALAIDSGAGKFEITGALSGNTGLVKTGAGTLLLTGNNTALTGATTVSQGTLLAGGLASNVTIAAGGGFGGAGTITGNVSYLGAGILQIGYTHNDATILNSSTLTITGSLGFAGAATIRVDMYENEVDTLVAGKAGFAGAANTIDLVNIQTGSFALFKLTAGTFDSALLSTLTTTQDGGGPLNVRASATYALNADQSELWLISGKTNHIVTWTGSTSGSWDSSGTNWKGGDTSFLSGDKVAFDSTDTAGHRDIDIMSTGVTVSELNITGNGSYTFTGGRITLDKASLGGKGSSFGSGTSNGAFTINTTGTVTLDNDEANIFHNGITLQQGTLVGNADTLGQNASIANNGSVIFNQTADGVFTGTLTGSGLLAKTGAGALLLTADNSGQTGALTLGGGALILDTGAKLGSATVTGSNTTLGLRDNALLSGTVTLQNSNVVLTNTAAIRGSVTLTGTGGVSIGNSSTIGGAVSTGTGHIIAGDHSVINGAAIAAIGHIQIGNNSTILNAATTGSGNIITGGNVSIGGAVSTGTGAISIGNNNVIGGALTAKGGAITIGASSTINGAAITTTHSIDLGGDSVITGSASASSLITLAANSRINSDATVANGLLILGTNAKVSGNATAANGITLLDSSEITGNATMTGTAPQLLGPGKIGGAVTSGSNTTIRVGNLANGSETLSLGSLTVGENSTILGTGTLATDYVHFTGSLTINNTANAALNITGSLTGAGALSKTGAGTLVLGAPSTYTGPTNITAGTLKAAAANALSPNSAHTIATGATLNANGYSQTVASLANNGTLLLGSPHTPGIGAASAGAKFTVNGAYAGAPGSVIRLNLIAADGVKTLSDQLVLANASAATGLTTIYVDATDRRSANSDVLRDIDPIVYAQAGTLDPTVFKLDDGHGFERVIIGQQDYTMVIDGQSANLTATAAAELPAALAINITSIFANRAALSSVGQRLDHLRTLAAWQGDLKYDYQVWAQGYYRRDKVDASLIPNTDGTTSGFQAGIDKQTDKAGKAFTTYGAFIDHTNAEADLDYNYSSKLTTTGLGGYISMHSGAWHTDLVARYSWDKYTITVGNADTMKPDGYTWSAMLRVARAYNLGDSWAITPQAQLIYQNRHVDDTTDTTPARRPYTFGPDNMRLNDPSSFEGRIGAAIRKIIALGEDTLIAPYLNFQYLYEFKGNLTVTTVNYTKYTTDLSDDSYLISAGLPVRLSKRFDIYVEASMQTGGNIDSHSINLGMNYRW